MDTITHIAFGAVTGYAVAGRKLGRKAMLAGALAANIPDGDAVLNFVMTDAQSMLAHRGFTHSLLFAIIVGPVLGWIASRIFRNQPATAGRWITLFTINLILHDLIDTCNMYGTGLLLPFSECRFSLDNIFVADPLYTIPLIVAAVVLFFKPNTPVAFKWVRLGYGLSTLYLMFTFLNYYRADNALEKAVKQKGIKTEKSMVAPTLFNTLLWYVIAEDKNRDGYVAGYWSVLDSYSPELYFISRESGLEKEITDSVQVSYLKRFSKGFYSYSEKNGKYYFNDLRFGQVNGWEDPESECAFMFDLTPGADNKLVIQEGRIKGTKKEVMKSMLVRILNEP